MQFKKRDKYLSEGTDFTLRGVRHVIKRRANNSRGATMRYSSKIEDYINYPPEFGWVDRIGIIWYETEIKDLIEETEFITEYKPGIVKMYNRIKLKL